jgi:hypothetical protein
MVPRRAAVRVAGVVLMSERRLAAAVARARSGERDDAGQNCAKER